MIVLPLTPEPPEPARAPLPPRAPAPAVLKLLALGFTPAERKLLDGVISLSRRRTSQIVALGVDEAAEADVIMIDGHDAQARAWAAVQPGLDDKAVIWVDGGAAGRGHTLVRRPVQWPSLNALLQKALEPEAARPLPASPAH